MKKLLLVALLFTASGLLGADLKVGVASKVITPELPFWLTGYASRTKPSTEVLHDLWAKAVVLEEKGGSRVVIVTTDLLGLSHEVSEDVAARVTRKYGIDRSQLLMNSSHTHCGPMVWPQLSMIIDFIPEDQQKAARYTRKLTDDIVAVIDSAMSHLTPMQIWCGHGSVGFAMNRREVTPNGIVNGKNRNGPVDHDVPVIKIATPDGTLKAILFGYACHNTTLNSYQINGDYAGFAQIDLQKTYPGVTAMFIMGCAGDQNPQPRGTVELAMQHGRSLSKAVQEALSGELHQVRPPIRTAFAKVDLDFRPFNLGSYQKDILSDNRYVQHRAKLMLEAYNKGWDLSRFHYPIQAVRFNKDLVILALSGEVVVDYSLRMKKMYSNENLFVAGYCNEVMCYIPSRRVLDEGGYEPNESMIYYGLPGPFAGNVEEKIVTAIQHIMRHVGARPVKK
jgi:hypothetical protein